MLTAKPTVAVTQPQWRDLRAVLARGKPRYRLISLAIGISLVEVGAGLTFPVLVKHLIDRFSTAGDTAAMLGDPLLILLVIVLLAGAAAGGFSTYILAGIGLRLTARIKSELARALMDHPVRFFDEWEAGEHVSRVSSDAAVISKFATTDVQGLVLGGLTLAGSIVVLSVLDWRLTAVIFTIILAAFAVMVPVVWTLARITRAINDGNARLSTLLARVFGEIRLVKASTAERLELAGIDAAIEDVRVANLASARVRAMLSPISSIALTSAMLAIFVYGGMRVGAGTLSIGTLTAFILYIFNIIGPLIQLSAFFTGFQSGKGASLRLREILEGPCEETESAIRPTPALHLAHPIEAIPYDTAEALHIRRLTLTHPSSPHPVLDLDELTFPAGQSTAIIGPSGSGKTTLLSLVERFYEPNSGGILWGERDIRSIPLARWRRSLGYVAQTAPVMAGTIAENIAYGCEGMLDHARVERAAEAANCTEFIHKLDRGFDAQVGEGGIRLSGGQRQRLAIARIFMRDPKLLLLDEVTSNLDSKSEDAVLSAIARLMIGRTTILVTHRLTSLVRVDHVAILEKGRCVTFGPRDAVLSSMAYDACENTLSAA